MHRRATTNSVASAVAPKPHASADAGIQIVVADADRAATVDAGNQRATATALLALPVAVRLRCFAAPVLQLSPYLLQFSLLAGNLLLHWLSHLLLH